MNIFPEGLEFRNCYQTWHKQNNCDLNFVNNQTQLSSLQVIPLPGQWSGNKHSTWHAESWSGHILTILGNNLKPWLYHSRVEPPLKSHREGQGIVCVGLCSTSFEQGMQASKGKTFTSQFNDPRTTLSGTETCWQRTAHAHSINLSCSPMRGAPCQSFCWECSC